MEALIDEMLDGRILLAEAVGEFEKIYIEKALDRNSRHIINTANALGIHRNTLARRVSDYNDLNGQRPRPKANSRKKAVVKKRVRSRK